MQQLAPYPVHASGPGPHQVCAVALQLSYHNVTFAVNMATDGADVYTSLYNQSAVFTEGYSLAGAAANATADSAASVTYSGQRPATLPDCDNRVVAAVREPG